MSEEKWGKFSEGFDQSMIALEEKKWFSGRICTPEVNTAEGYGVAVF